MRARRDGDRALERRAREVRARPRRVRRRAGAAARARGAGRRRARGRLAALRVGVRSASSAPGASREVLNQTRSRSGSRPRRRARCATPRRAARVARVDDPTSSPRPARPRRSTRSRSAASPTWRVPNRANASVRARARGLRGRARRAARRVRGDRRHARDDGRTSLVGHRLSDNPIVRAAVDAAVYEDAGLLALDVTRARAARPRRLRGARARAARHGRARARWSRAVANGTELARVAGEHAEPGRLRREPQRLVRAVRRARRPPCPSRRSGRRSRRPSRPRRRSRRSPPRTRFTLHSPASATRRAGAARMMTWPSRRRRRVVRACGGGGYAYFASECPMGDYVHCQCSNSMNGTDLSDSCLRGRGDGDGNLWADHAHCVGPYVVDGWFFGTTASVLRTRPGPSERRSRRCPQSRRCPRADACRSRRSPEPTLLGADAGASHIMPRCRLRRRRRALTRTAARRHE